ncbi:MAG: sulfotransferase domain-containing protein [Arenimonas sp.]
MQINPDITGMDSCLPNLLCIGAAKCGTTWLANVLSSHPEIYLPPQKELNILHYQDIDERLHEYKGYFAGIEQETIRADFSVRYLASPRAPAASARLIGKAKILVVLRNPVDQVQSHYWHLRRQNFHQAEPVQPAPDIFSALEKYPDLLLEPALYGKHIQRWLEHFPREQLLVIHNRDLFKDTDRVLAGICDFLEIKSFDFSPAIEKTTATEGRAGVQPREGIAGKIFPKLYVAVTRGPYLWLKRRIGVQGAENLKRRLRLRQVSEAVFFKSGYPKLDPSERLRLQQYFTSDMALLNSLGFIDTSDWQETNP